MDADTETYHFRIDDADPFGGVLEAIQFVKGRDALELEPLGRVVDPDALDTLVSESSSVSVSFTVDDLEVEVTSAGDIYVADTTPDAFIHESIDGAANVLLTTHSHSHEACVDLLSVAPYDQENLLGVLHAESFDRRVSAWEQYMDERPADTAAINLGDFPRSSAAATTRGAASGRLESFSYIPDASDLPELAATITERLGSLAASDRQLVVCFDSVTRLLQTTPREQALEFLRATTDRMATADAVAHYHFDPEPFGEETVSAVTDLFDSRVVVAEDGDWTVQ
ncbi:hypothetical protein SAMN05216559_2108 [Halomicrobium zhouii]|uniref:Halobacterial output domain-containing protein n=1 Tax=Halomicrobium zhouii TaxID=767519 RepID=A0A1I6L6H9_9EURY|nr:HalOD1 output domain-containing protein [Halomicrobium zhouii]SFR98838.1 hypothetical protein SAMN05216559_2108 [Halomicrobium zhouii]